MARRWWQTWGAAGRLSASFLYGAPESRWLVNGNILRAVYRLLHITGVSLGNFSVPRTEKFPQHKKTARKHQSFC